MKIEIELNMPGDSIFLNFWNYFNGDDVVCEVVDNKLMLSQYDKNGEELPKKEITIEQFAGMIRDRVKEIKDAKQ